MCRLCVHAVCWESTGARLVATPGCGRGRGSAGFVLNRPSLPGPQRLKSWPEPPPLDGDLRSCYAALGYCFVACARCCSAGAFRERVCGRERGSALPAWPIAATLEPVLVSGQAALGQAQGPSSWGAPWHPQRWLLPFLFLPRPGRGAGCCLCFPSDHCGGTPQLVHSFDPPPVCFYMNNHPVCASLRTKNH